MGIFPRLVALALGFTAGSGDVPARDLAPAVAQTACQGLAHLCPQGAGAPILDHGVCLSLALSRTQEYVVCWPGAGAAPAYPGRHAGKLVLAAFHEGDRPCTASGSCGIRYRCVCLNAGGDPPAFALTLALPHPASLHATGCLILAGLSGTQPTNPALAVSPIVTLRL